jgi:pyridoxine 5-phosphate synthase
LRACGGVKLSCDSVGFRTDIDSPDALEFARGSTAVLALPPSTAFCYNSGVRTIFVQSRPPDARINRRFFVARLGVNVDHVATLRQARGGNDPDPLAAAVLVELAGADGIVVHLREDRRHIQDRDLRLLRELIRTKLDMEMAADETMAKIALTVKPDLVTLVPEKRQELTTEGGLDVPAHKDRLQQVIGMLHDGGIPVSLFIEPDLGHIKAAHKISADFVELHTGRYANAKRSKEADAEFEAITQAAKLAYKLGMGVNAGHGLNYQNVKRLTHIPEIVEYNIGHSIIARAVLVGLDQAVREMKALLN